MKLRRSRTGRVGARSILREAADYRALGRTPYGYRPIALLTVIAMVAAFDGAVFGVVFPTIVRELDVDIVQILSLVNLASFLLIGVGFVLSFVLDRVRRVPFAALGAVVDGLFSIFTARSSSAGQVAGSRAVDQIGGRIQGLPTVSLVADYYPPDTRGRAFAVLLGMSGFVRVAAPFLIGLLVVAGGTAAESNWRLPYLISGPALIVVGLASLLFLREPIRGYMERRALGVSEDVARIPEPRPSFGEAWRTLWSIRVFRRRFIANIPQQLAQSITLLVFPLWLAERYGLDALGIGKLASIVGAVGLLTAFLGGGILDSLTTRSPRRVLVFVGLLGVASALPSFVIASGPPLWGLYAAALVMSLVSSTREGPAIGVINAQVVPANMRTLGVSVDLLSRIPAAIIFQLAVIPVVATAGLQGGLWLAAPLLLVGALIDLSAASFFERDMRAAMASQLASEEWRKAKERGAGKLLVCRDIDVSYDGVQVLFGVDFDVAEGEIVALLGTNGAGKSTLLRAISGSHEASSGAIVLDGRDITHMPPAEVAGRGVVLMPGGRGIFPGLSVRQNLMLGTWISSDKQAPAENGEVLSIFPELRARLDEPAGALSGGEQQMLSLAQALSSKPRLLMIDELSLGLAPAVVEHLIKIVKQINARGTAVVLVEQSVNVALTVAERAVFMEKGEVRFSGKAADLLQRPDILRAVYVKGASGPVGATPRAGMARPSGSGRPVLEVRGVGKRFGGVEALRDVTLELREGEVLGIIGPNGAGKTTLFDVISGSIEHDGGQIILDGVDVSRMTAAERSARRIVRRFQDARLAPSLTVEENILLALDRTIQTRNVVSVALHTPGARLGERRVRRRAEELIELLRLADHKGRYAKELSTGLRRIVDLACVLATEPTVLLLDEPSTGIAQAEAQGLAPLLRRVRAETGCSILIIEHDMSLIRRVADELVAMDQGAVVVRGTPEDVLNDERVIRAYLGAYDDVVRPEKIRLP